MSLFQVREWWSTKSGTNEEYDAGCMSVDNVDNEPSGAVKIVTGSFKGYLRVFYPRQREFRIEDLMLEENLDDPILQIAVGKFIPSSQDKAIAVLHPRRLVVYSLQAVGGVGAAASYYELHKNYEHKLGVDGAHFTAFNMCFGPFGGAHGRDLICVQSMDVQLQVFDLDRYAFTRQLRSLVPGPICYSTKMDSIITSNTKMQVECYRYLVLAASTSSQVGKGGEGGEEKQSSSSISRAKEVQVDWASNVGETVVDIKIARLSTSLGANQQDIVVVGEHTLLTLKEQGDVRMQHRLNYFPSCCAAYDCARGEGYEGGANQHLLIGGHDNRINVYRDTQLIWAARAPSTSSLVQLAVAEFGAPNTVRGLVVALDAEGNLTVNYMGTDPPNQSVGATENKELNYEEMDDEHRRLLNIIRESQSDQRMEPRERVLLRAQVPSIVDAPGEGVEDEVKDEDLCAKADDGSLLQITTRLFVSYTGSDTLTNVNISLEVPDCIIARESAVLLPHLDGSTSTPVIIPLAFRANSTLTPNSLTVKVVAAYSTEGGEPRTAQCDLLLPMCLVCRLVAPVKHNTFKFTLDTNRLPPQLSSLFEDMLTQPGITEEFVARVAGSAANVLSFQYANGAAATILVSKNAGRYRVQAATLEALWMVASGKLARRLQEHFADLRAGGEEPFEIKYHEPLPLADFFATIDDHFDCRKELTVLNADLTARAHQFRIIQKRLLLRFKDRNPSPLNQLDTIMHGTYTQLIDLADKCAACQQKLKQASVVLSCAAYLMLMLIRYRFDLDQENYDMIKAHLSPDVVDNNEQGWEEATDAAMTNVLRTSLAKSAKESAAVPPPLQMPEDTSKLKKHITIVCDRLAKGARLTPTASKKSDLK